MEGDKLKRMKNLSIFGAGFLAAAFVFAGLLTGFNFALAWNEPTGNAPANNVKPPLNEGTPFGKSITNNMITGIFSDLRIKECDPGTNKVLQWDGAKWICGTGGGNQDLYKVLTAGSNASTFAGNVSIGDATHAANMYLLGGEFSSKWIHTTASGVNTIMGSLGIGANYSPTIVPGKKLEIVTGQGGTDGIRLTYAAGYAPDGLDIQYLNSGNTTAYFDSRYNGPGSDGAAMQFRMKTNNVSTLVNAMTILGNGKVGIGTIPTDSSKTLTIKADNVAFGGGINIISSGTASPVLQFDGSLGYQGLMALALTDGHYSENAKAGDLVIRTKDKNIIFANNSTNDKYPASMIITQAGKVGIGTANPSAMLSLGDAYSLADTKLALYDGGDKYGLGVQPSQFRIHLGNSTNRFTFLDAPQGNELVNIYGTGNASPYRMNVNGKVNATGFCINGNCNIIGGGDGTPNYWTPSGSNIYNNNAGNVGIGTNNPQRKLDVNGNMNVTGNVKISQSADHLTKDGIIFPDNSKQTTAATMKVYTVRVSQAFVIGVTVTATCDAGDIAIGGGASSLALTGFLTSITSYPVINDDSKWACDMAGEGFLTCYAKCLDNPPLR